MKHVLMFILVISFVGCSNASKQSNESMSEEVSLKADRSEYDQLRKDMPAEVRKENDELAGILQMLRSEEHTSELQSPC